MQPMNGSQPAAIEPAIPENIFALGPYCQIYHARISRILKDGGLGPMDGVEWSLIKGHAENCPHCSCDDHYLAGVRSLEQGARHLTSLPLLRR